jgi:hypothetical protein
LTCEPNNAMGELHDRMPVILAEIDWPTWLGEEPASEQELLTLLKPCPDEVLKIWPVDRMVCESRERCFAVRSATSATAHLWCIAPLLRSRFALSCFYGFAACSGAPSHCLPQGSGQGIVAGQACGK